MTAAATARQHLPARARLRTLLGRVPRAAWVCALVGVLNATAWCVLVPAFQIPDEQSHYAYVEYFVQHGRPPSWQARDTHSSSEDTALEALKFREIQFAAEDGTIWSAAEQARMTQLLHRPADRTNGNGSGNEVGSEPSLFYMLQAIPYTVASGGTVIDRLQLMRLLSALLAGLTVLFVYLFLREALPAVPETWTVGALGVAFTPMFAFISSGVNPDALLFAGSAAVFAALARAFRRGLTQRRAVAIGAATAVALMAKFNAIGLLPGVALALLVLGVRRERALRPRALALPALALGVAFAPLLLEAALNATVWQRAAFGAGESNYRLSELHPSLGDALSYAWQFYLVPLPGMTHYLHGVPFRRLWLNGFLASFGWLDGTFRPAVYHAALVPLSAVALLAVRALVTMRAGVRARRIELLCYLALALAFMGFIASASYISFLRYHSNIGQIRYLFPLLAGYGALLALAARGAGRRWAPVLGTAIVALAIAHDLFSQLIVIARYYN
ncbi:MAG TPA: DUF2142 domain-containing protein [Conexibacter sp.]|nr:DUF2142 domain-containing protein [Conexibacter sp.]